jgi:hypothetical protein
VHFLVEVIRGLSNFGTMTTFSLYLLDEVHEIVYKDPNVHGNRLRQYGRTQYNGLRFNDRIKWLRSFKEAILQLREFEVV